MTKTVTRQTYVEDIDKADIYIPWTQKETDLVSTELGYALSVSASFVERALKGNGFVDGPAR